MFGNCSGYTGANSDAIDPSGRMRARYSPLELRLNRVCNGAPGTRRSLPEAKTIRKPPGGRLVAGNCHLARSALVSVRNQPPRFTVLVPELKSSIQSE